ncbi:MAG: NAD(P)H-dependent oxidoreductase [Gordonia sp. (in: high G+C Gram-positive bacteria)]
MSDSTVRVVALVGSLRRDSINLRLARAAVEHAPAGVAVTVAPALGDLPFYNEDIDPGTGAPGAVPEAVAGLRELVGAADAVLVVTPEYNGSTPAALSNAIDWLSRPYGSGAIKDKPVGVIGAALGRHAGTWSRADTRKSLGVAGGTVLTEIDYGVRASGLEGALPGEVLAELRAVVQKLADAVPVSASRDTWARRD